MEIVGDMVYGVLGWYWYWLVQIDTTAATQIEQKAKQSYANYSISLSDFLVSSVALLELFAVVFASRERERGREEERKEGTERAKETRAKEQATIKQRERETKQAIKEKYIGNSLKASQY